MDDRQPLSAGFGLDDGVEIVSLQASDALCLTYRAVGKAGRALAVKEYFPHGIARRAGPLDVGPAAESDGETYTAGLQSFVAYCERLAAIEHPAVQPLLGLLEGHGTAYLVLDGPQGPSLDAWLKSLGRPPTVDEIRAIADGLCEGLAVAHAADLLHLDLAPDVVSIDGAGRPVLTEFSATAVSFAATAGRPPVPPKTGYAPIEREVDDLLRMGPRTDVYGAAAILFRLVAGEPPPGARARRDYDSVPEKLAPLYAAFPHGLIDGIGAGLALDAENRPATATAFHDLLREPQAAPKPTRAATVRATASARPEPKPEAGPRPDQRPAPGRSLLASRPLLVAAAAGLVALIGVAALSGVEISLTDDPPPPPPPPVAAGKTTPEPAPAARPKAASASTETPPPPATLPARKPGERFRDCSDCAEMVVIPAGSFRMGSPVDERGHELDEAPERTVDITRPFAMSRGAVTRAEFELFVAATGYAAGACRIFESGKWVVRTDLSYRNPGFRQDGDHPVVCVNWNDARAYASWLSTRTGKTYRLPSEAEWEYAARAGTRTPFWWGSEISTDQANYDGSLTYGSGRPGENRAATVRAIAFEPNPFGLYQVHGNVSQWVDDCWNGSYRGAPVNGTAWLDGDCQRRILRGGSWGYAPKDLRAAYREGATLTNRNFNFGFRLVRELDQGR